MRGERIIDERVKVSTFVSSASGFDRNCWHNFSAHPRLVLKCHPATYEWCVMKRARFEKRTASDKRCETNARGPSLPYSQCDMKMLRTSPDLQAFAPSSPAGRMRSQWLVVTGKLP